jgi:uncharacterized protein (DUF433 family)
MDRGERMIRKTLYVAERSGRTTDAVLREALAAYEAETSSTLDWSQCPAVERVPGRVSGAWVFRDTRLPVSVVFANLEAGATVDEISEWFDVSAEQVRAVIDFATRSLDTPSAR